LKKNNIWKNNSGVKISMQIASTLQITFQEYEQLKNILKEKSVNIGVLPELKSVVMDLNSDLQNERDVELEILELLLKKLDFKESNWIRQLKLRMGRGERNYHDYALLVNIKNKYEETAKLLWEAKYRICNRKEVYGAFL
jgi:hypothetical protein